MAALAKGKMKSKTEVLKKALRGFVGSHQRMILSAMLQHLDYLEGIVKRSVKRLEGLGYSVTVEEKLRSRIISNIIGHSREFEWLEGSYFALCLTNFVFRIENLNPLPK